MSITATNVKARAPEFASLSDSVVEIFMDDASARIDLDMFGDLYDLGHLYLTAHLLSVAYPALATASGPVQSETVGQVSRTYAVSAASSSGGGYNTKWGAEYKRLTRSIPYRFGVT